MVAVVCYKEMNVLVKKCEERASAGLLPVLFSVRLDAAVAETSPNATHGRFLNVLENETVVPLSSPCIANLLPGGASSHRAISPDDMIIFTDVDNLQASV
jgi:hypothetical protein